MISEFLVAGELEFPLDLGNFEDAFSLMAFSHLLESCTVPKIPSAFFIPRGSFSLNAILSLEILVIFGI